MKIRFIAIFLIFSLLFSSQNIFATTQEGITQNIPDIDYPQYYGSKKCYVNSNNTKESSAYISFGETIFTSKSYSTTDTEGNEVWHHNLYKNGELYDEDTSSVWYESNGKVIYEKLAKNHTPENRQIEIYENKNLIATGSFVELHSISTSWSQDYYIIPFIKDNKTLYIINGKVEENPEYVSVNEYFSPNNQHFIQVWGGKFADGHANIKITKDDKILFEEKNSALQLQNIAISHSGKFYILLETRDWEKTILIDENGQKEIPKQKFEYFSFSSENDDFFSISVDSIKRLGIDPDDMPRDFTLYKNFEKILSFTENVYEHTVFPYFEKNGDYSLILTNWDQYMMIKNGKIEIPLDADKQIKAIYKDNSGNIFRVEKIHSTNTEILFKNNKEVFRGKRVDERYLMGGVGTFSLFPIAELQADQYYTYVQDFKDKDWLYVNGFKIDNHYDYMQFDNKSGLNKFQFLGQRYGQIECQDITTIHNMGIMQNFILNILSIIRDLPENQKLDIQQKIQTQLQETQKDSLSYDILKSIESATQIHTQ